MIDTILIHDTLRAIDTVKVNIPTANSFSWSLILSTSCVTAIIVFVLTFFKDLLFEKIRKKEVRNKIKFENAHQKRVEIIEKIIKDISKCTESILLYFKFGYSSGIGQENNHFEKYYDVMSEIGEFIKFLNNSRLYISDTLYKLIYNLMDLYRIEAISFYCKVSGRSVDNRDLQYFITAIEQLDSLRNEILNISKKTIEEEAWSELKNDK